MIPKRGPIHLRVNHLGAVDPLNLKDDVSDWLQSELGAGAAQHVVVCTGIVLKHS